MAKTFDPSKPFSAICGDSLAAFYQGGKYFSSDGKKLSKVDAGKPSENGSFTNQVEARVGEELSKENAKKPLKVIDDQNPRKNSPDDIEAARKRAEARKVKEPVPKQANGAATAASVDTNQAKRAELNKLHITQLRELVAKAGQVPKTGRGSKAANIKLLIENTE